MKYLIFLLFFPLSLASQKIADFPRDFLGIWTGDLAIFTPQGQVQSVPMQLHILPVNDSTYTYTIIYGEDVEKGKRDYLLRQGKEGPHHWIVDEQDGILLDNFYIGGVLHGPFSVNGTLLYSSLSLEGENLAYTISSGRASAYRNSRASAGQEGTEETYEVAAFEVRNFQKASLKRKKWRKD